MMIRLVAVLITAAALTAGTCHAQSYPSKPIRWIVPYTPGGITDTVTRLVTQKLQTAWHVRSGKIKALALFARERIPGAAEVPTIVEAGGPPIESATWIMILAPAGTPADIVNRVSHEIAKSVAATDLRERLVQMGIQPFGRTPEATAQFLNDEIAKWGKVIAAAGVKADQ